MATPSKAAKSRMRNNFYDTGAFAIDANPVRIVPVGDVSALL